MYTSRLASHGGRLPMRTPQPKITLPDDWDPECPDHWDPYNLLLKAVPPAVLERIPLNNVPPTDLIGAHYVFESSPDGRYAAYLTTIPDLGILHCLRSLRPRFKHIKKCGAAIQRQFFAGLDQFLTQTLPHITPIERRVVPSMDNVSKTNVLESDSLWRSFARLNTIEELSKYSDNADVESMSEEDARVVELWQGRVRRFAKRVYALERAMWASLRSTIRRPEPMPLLTRANLDLWNATTREEELAIGPYSDDAQSDAYVDHDYICGYNMLLFSLYIGVNNASTLVAGGFQ
ncbi:hypothetical protein BDZ89DRAFT_1046360 [Hymenopellis radicata]|nr:hypothetical protein BDZ89DRAFT_1046360 [Hymenopellis radicata]